MSLGRAEAASLERPILASAQLLVEGRSAEIFFREMIEALGLRATIEVRTFGSKEKETLQAYLEILVAKAAFKDAVRALGIIRDAEDQQADAAFRSICAALKRVGLPQPSKLREFASGGPQVGVFILPDCHAAGMLETLCLEVARESRRQTAPSPFTCVDEFVSCLSKLNMMPSNGTKAALGTSLVSQGVYEAQVGRAAQMKLFPWDAPGFGSLREFFSELSRAGIPKLSLPNTPRAL